MAEKVVSPGVFSNEIDASFLPAAIGDIGAAIIGPTVKGPALVPTVVTSYSQFQQIFGDSFKSGSTYVQYLTSHAAENYLKHSGQLTVVRILDGSPSRASAIVQTGSGTYYTGSNVVGAGDSGVGSFTINTINHGQTLNNAPPSHSLPASASVGNAWSSSIGSNNTLLSGSKDNVRWEIPSTNPKKGTFNLLVRQGNDTIKRKQILETWNNLSLDPNSNNYISKRIGDQYVDFGGTSTDPYLTYNGDYPNKSKYIYISGVTDTVDYLNENGNVRIGGASSSLPGIGSGSLQGGFSGGSTGYGGFDSLGNAYENFTGSAVNFYNNISSTNSQGFKFASGTSTDGTDAYIKAIGLLNNQDEYDINMLLIPGICDSFGNGHSSIITKAIDVCEDRGDCFLIYDTVGHGETNIPTVTGKAEERDTNYAATYWPWVKINDSQII